MLSQLLSNKQVFFAESVWAHSIAVRSSVCRVFHVAGLGSSDQARSRVLYGLQSSQESTINTVQKTVMQ